MMSKLHKAIENAMAMVEMLPHAALRQVKGTNFGDFCDIQYTLNKNVLHEADCLTQDRELEAVAPTLIHALRKKAVAAIYHAGERCKLRRAIQVCASNLTPQAQRVFEHMLHTMFSVTVEPFFVFEDDYGAPLPG